MFIKWRTYQRQLDHQKGGKFIQQPVVMHAMRGSKKALMLAGHSKEEVDIRYERLKAMGLLKHFQRSRQLTIMKLPVFQTCMVLHLDAVNQIMNRKTWWAEVDRRLGLLPKYAAYWNVDEKVVQKLKNDIESYVPRISQKDEEIIAKAEAMFGE